MPKDYPQPFEALWSIYPKRIGGNSKVKAFKAYTARLKSYDYNDIAEGVKKYALFCDKTGKTNTEYVMMAATFFGPNEHFLEPWDLPNLKPEWATLPKDNNALWDFAKQYGFSDPGQLYFDQYRKKLEGEIEKRLRNA